MEHDLKCWPLPFDAVRRGIKPFEIRFDGDRNFQPGDTLLLREWCPVLKKYSGRFEQRLVTYKLDGGFGLQPGFCALAIVPISKS